MWRRLQAIALSGMAMVALAAGEGGDSAGGKFAAPVTAVAPQQIGGDGPGFLQIFGSLLLVIATILVIGWFAKRMRAIPRTRAGALRVVDEMALGPKERAVLVEVDGARLVIGVGDGRVTLLHRSERAAEGVAGSSLVNTPASAAGSNAVPAKFVDLLRQSLGK